MKRILLCFLLLGQFFLVNGAYAVKTDAELRARSIDSSRTLESRVRALKKLYKHLLVNGEIPERRTCVWDVLGRQGPIYAASVDMKVRFKFYGINIDVEAYTDEEEAIKGLESGHGTKRIRSPGWLWTAGRGLRIPASHDHDELQLPLLSQNG